MKKVVLLTFVLVLLSTAVVVRFISPVVSYPAETKLLMEVDLPVHNINSGKNFSTIQEAINDNETLDGHTIQVDSGTYYEHAIVNKALTLIGEDKYNTIIDGSGVDRVIDVTSDNVKVSGFTLQHGNEGIHLEDSCNNIITYNIVTNNTWAGIVLYANSDNCTIQGNTVSFNQEGIKLYSSNDNTIDANQVVENVDGIRLDYSTDNLVSYNNATLNAYCGIHLDNSENSNVKKNVVTLNSIGIMQHASEHNVIEDNKVTNNGEGILLAFSNCNVVEANEAVENGGNGIRLYNSSYNEVRYNNASIDDTGMVLETSSNNNTLVGNNIASNYNGILLGYSSNNNSIYHNNLLHNTVQVVHVAGLCVNVWDDDYPSGGNYWSNYTGVDSDHDGIGDTTHEIDADNIDNYPLMGMFSDFNATSEHHVQTICNSTISDFQFNGTAISFNVTGENDTTGFCRICIPKALMNDTFRVFVNGTEILPSPEPLPCSNSTHNYLYFTYDHSTQEVVIVPEFPTWTSMLLILIVLTVAIAIYKRRILKTPIH